VVRPHIGVERAATLEVRVVGREAELIVGEGRDVRAEPVFDADEALNVDAG
jgi:hypothetical protein